MLLEMNLNIRTVPEIQVILKYAENYLMLCISNAPNRIVNVSGVMKIRF